MKQKVVAVVGLIALVLLVAFLPYERQSSGITELLYLWGEQQEQTSDKITSEVVSGVEGTYVGEHEVDGSNWSIPNLIRHWLGGE